MIVFHGQQRRQIVTQAIYKNTFDLIFFKINPEPLKIHKKRTNHVRFFFEL